MYSGNMWRSSHFSVPCSLKFARLDHSQMNKVISDTVFINPTISWLISNGLCANKDMKQRNILLGADTLHRTHTFLLAPSNTAETPINGNNHG